MNNEEENKTQTSTPVQHHGPMGRGGNTGEKAKDFKGTVKRLFKELGSYKIAIAFAFIFSIVGSIITIIAPDKLSDITDTITAGMMGNIDLDKIKSIAIILSIMYIAAAIFTFAEGIIMATISNKFAQKLRGNISTKINKLPLRYYDKHSVGDTLSRITNDVDTVAQMMNQSLGTLIANITLFLGSIVMMFYTNWIMAITAILSSLVGFVFMFLILGKSQKYFVERQEELGKINGHIEEVYSGINLVKI